MTLSLSNVRFGGAVTMSKPPPLSFSTLINIYGLHTWDIGAVASLPVPEMLGATPFDVLNGTPVFQQSFTTFPSYQGVTFDDEDFQWVWTADNNYAVSSLPESVTVGCIVRTPPSFASSSQQMLMGKGGATGGSGSANNALWAFGFIDGDGTLLLQWEYGTNRTDVNIKTTGTLNENTEYFLAVTRNSVTKKVDFYVDGVLFEGDKSYTTNPDDGSTQRTTIGGDGLGGHGVEGATIGVPFVGRTPLSANAISNLYQSLLV